MKKLFVKKQERKLGFIFKILLGSLVLVAVVGLCNAAQAAKGDADRLTDTLLFNQTSFFDPFTLKTIIPTTKSGRGPSNVPSTAAQDRLVPTTKSGRGPSNVPFTGAQDQLFLTTESSLGPDPAILGGLGAQYPVLRPPIRIPFRPVLRSPYRP
jgi:hypothetical protein